MKIIYKKGNLINATEHVIAHGCNNRGVMGSGVAREIRNKFPEAYYQYKEMYKSHGLKLGQVYWCLSNGKHIINCITQDGYGKDGKKYICYKAIRRCMRDIECSWPRYNQLLNPISNYVALPKIGAGLGGGDWNIISKIIEKELISIQPVVYELE